MGPLKNQHKTDPAKMSEANRSGKEVLCWPSPIRTYACSIGLLGGGEEVVVGIGLQVSICHGGKPLVALGTIR